MSISLGVADTTLLKALFVYKYLTVAQTIRLLYRPGTLTTVQTRYKKLAEAGSVCRIELPATGRFGSGPYLYTLAAAGRAYLRREYGMAMRRHHTPAEERSHGLDYWSHLLALNDVLIGLARLVRNTPELSLGLFLHDLDMREHPLTVELVSGKRERLIPDALLRFDVRGSPHQTVLVELHRATNHQVRTRQQLTKHLAWLRDQLTAGVAHPVVAFFTTAGETRLNNLLTWAEAELTQYRDLAHYFRFAAGTPAALDSRELACAPRWRQPFRTGYVPLLTRPLRRSLDHLPSRPLHEARGEERRRRAGVSSDAKTRRQNTAPAEGAHVREAPSPMP